MNVNKNYTAIAFIVWMLILFIELFWLFVQVDGPSYNLHLITVIVVTLVVGSTWFRVFGNTNDE